MNKIEIGLVRCAATDCKRSEMATITIDESVLTERLIRQAEQVLAADEAKGMHLAADDAEHGEVTYLQEVLEGGFFVYVGQPDALQEHWFGAGSWVAFNDHEGSGHASKVGPDGCKRNFRLLRGRLS